MRYRKSVMKFNEKNGHNHPPPPVQIRKAQYGDYTDSRGTKYRFENIFRCDRCSKQ